MSNKKEQFNISFKDIENCFYEMKDEKEFLDLYGEISSNIKNFQLKFATDLAKKYPISDKRSGVKEDITKLLAIIKMVYIQLICEDFCLDVNGGFDPEIWIDFIIFHIKGALNTQIKINSPGDGDSVH